MARDCEAQSGVHAAGIALDGRVDEVLDFGELNDLIELPSDIDAFHAHDGTLQKHVLPASQVGVETCGDFDKHTHAAVDFPYPAIGTEDLGEELEDRRLASTIGPHYSESLTHTNVERNVTDSPEFLLAKRGTSTYANKPPRNRWDQVTEAVMNLTATKFLPNSVK